MTRGIPATVVGIVVAISSLGIGLRLAGADAPTPLRGAHHPVVPAEEVARELAAARAAAASSGSPLSEGHRVLEQLTLREGGGREPVPLVLTPENVGHLARAGLRDFLRGRLPGGTQALSSGSTVVQLQAVKDNTLYETVDGSLSNGAGEQVFVGRTGVGGGGAIRRAVLAFDVAGTIPPGATVQAASLDFNVSNAPLGGGSVTLMLQRLTADWGEGPSSAIPPGGAGGPSAAGDATWLHTFYPGSNWASAGGDYSGTVSASTVVSGPNPYSFASTAQLTADVQDMLDNPATDHGWVIRGNEASMNTARRIDSRDNQVASVRPVLSVTVTGVDLTPPTVAWVAPAPAANLTPEVPVTLEWTASDPSGVAFLDILASYDGGVTYQGVALGLAGTTTQYLWYPPNRPGPTTLRIRATDGAMNTGDTDLGIAIQSVFVSIFPTTLRDYDQPGTQPLEHGLDVFDPSACSLCHGDYDDTAEPFFGWSGSMMANAARDPLFEACLTIAEQDANGSGDLCIRCHVPKSWVEGRSIPTDGSQILGSDRTGVSCDHCHRMVDPVYEPGVSPAEDLDILAALSNPPDTFGTGRYVLDPTGTRRGPFADAICDEVAHPFLASPFHREAEMCASCHNVSNPAWESDGMGGFVQNFDQPAASFGHGDILPIERTYSEWLHSDYNSPAGVFNPAMGGNRDYVSTCQDCHMRATTGTGCNPSFFPTAPVRNDLPQHDLTGGNTWIPTLLDDLFPGEVDPLALQDAVDRARYMLQNSATLEGSFANDFLTVRVTNETGHKLPTGYPEGRRMWLNVRFLDPDGNLVKESGAYDPATGVLTEDAEIKLYEMKAGLDASAAIATGMPEGPTFHFVLNNKIYKDNRIPPRGFDNATFASFGGAPVAYSYADGQYWDDTTYLAPKAAHKAVITLYYQTTSKEYIEFLRDENVTDNKGQLMYDLWEQNGKCPPEVMERTTVYLYEPEALPVPGPGPGPGRGITR